VKIVGKVKRMKKVWKQLRLLLAEKILSLAIDIAPKNTKEKADISLLVGEYCKKHSKNIRKF